MSSDYDLIIVGAGLAGNCLALALQHSGLRIAIVEAAERAQLEQSPAGDRALALAAGTVEALQRLGCWDDVRDKATAIRHIHVSDRGHFGKARLHADDYQVEALGYVIAARDIEQNVARQLDRSAIARFYDTRLCGIASAADLAHLSLKHNGRSLNFSTRLLVGADGGSSSVRNLLGIEQTEIEYGQTAIVTTVRSEKAHGHVAYERFTASGPLALLPSDGRQCSVVWTRRHEQAEELMSLNEAEFLAALQDCFGYRLGYLQLTAPRSAFPLKLVRARQMIAERTVLIGNAVHQLHPVAGQGFNLGMRDVELLAQLLIEDRQQADDPGASLLLKDYARQRKRDHDTTIGFTNQLVHWFSNQNPAAAAARNTGLTLLDHIPFAKRLLARHAMGFGR
jgi:2-octaprenyl-6-methoxyphenol hydroxylase